MGNKVGRRFKIYKRSAVYCIYFSYNIKGLGILLSNLWQIMTWPYTGCSKQQNSRRVNLIWMTLNIISISNYCDNWKECKDILNMFKHNHFTQDFCTKIKEWFIGPMLLTYSSSYADKSFSLGISLSCVNQKEFVMRCCNGLWSTVVAEVNCA